MSEQIGGQSADILQEIAEILQLAPGIIKGLVLFLATVTIAVIVLILVLIFLVVPIM